MIAVLLPTRPDLGAKRGAPVLMGWPLIERIQGPI